MSKKIKVAFLLSMMSERGGIGRVTSMISNRLNQNEKYDVHLISYTKKTSNAYGWNDELPYHHLMEKQIPMKKGLVKAVPKLRKIISENQIDILISCGVIVGPLGAFATVFKKTKFIYWSHTSLLGSSKKQFRIPNEHISSFFCDRLITLTKTDEINYQQRTRAKDIIQIYNPIDNALETKNKVYDSESNKIISVGRLTYQKNFDAIIDIVQEILKKNSNFTWDIYGSGEDYEKLSEKITSNELNDYIHLKGQTNKLYDLYNDYKLMVMTSRFEGFPMSLLEGVASKLPLVSFDIPTGPNEIIEDGVNGYLIPPFHTEIMANKILDLLGDAEKCRKFSDSNSKKMEEFNLNSILKKWSVALEF